VRVARHSLALPRTSMRTPPRIVPALIAIVLIGCPGEARFRIAFEGSNKLRDEIKYKFLENKAEVKFGANCYGGLVTLHVKIKNESDDVIVYDWSNAEITLGSGLSRRLDSGSVTLYDQRSWQRSHINPGVPPGAEWTYDIGFPRLEQEVDSSITLVHMKPGRILRRDGFEICRLPVVCGDLKETFITPFRR